MNLSSAIGITTTVPVEIIFAAGRIPVDLNNIFIADESTKELMSRAENAGFPQSACAWIKGIYGAVCKHNIREVIGVVEGDCSDTRALLEILQSEGIKVHPFGYPHDRDPEKLLGDMQKLAEALGTTLQKSEEIKNELDEIRMLSAEIDRLAYTESNVSSQMLFDALLLCCDFMQNPQACKYELEKMLEQIKQKPQKPAKLRLACIGVPPVFNNMWAEVDSLGARVVYHETPQEFSRIDALRLDLCDSYVQYTYPYDVFSRAEKIAQEVKKRNIDGVIHYVQSFCHRQIQDRLLRENIDVPVLTLEGDRPAEIDGRTKIRLEAFVEQLESSKK